jgi:hypothetical protein
MSRSDTWTTEPAVLLEDTISTARQSLVVLASSAVRIAGRFRAGEAEVAAGDLRGLVEAIRYLTELTRAIAEVIDLRQTGASTVQTADGAGPTAAMRQALHQLVDCQARQDWNQTAWCLEHALAPAVIGWQGIFDRFDRQRAAA